MDKENLVNYLVDVLGHSEEEAKTITSAYGTTYLTEEELEECRQYSA